MKEFVQRLSSRKFLLAVAAFCTALANGEVVAAVGAAVAYVAAEGYVDGKREE